MAKADIGMAGMAVMGSNLAQNMERNGHTVAVWNREPATMDKFMANEGQGKRFVPSKSPEEFVKSLKRPRRIVMLIKAGAPVDWTIDQFKPFLEEGDILIDGGNSWFEDTRRREAALRAEKLRFIGSGVSGGEEGALWGPVPGQGPAAAAAPGPGKDPSRAPEGRTETPADDLRAPLRGAEACNTTDQGRRGCHTTPAFTLWPRHQVVPPAPAFRA